MIKRPELAWIREGAWDDLVRDAPDLPFVAFVTLGRVLRGLSRHDPLRAELQALRDALLRREVLAEVDALWTSTAEVMGEILDDLHNPEYTPSRLDALALYHHREELESLREGVERVIALLPSWPEAPLDHAVLLLAEFDAVSAHIEERYLSDDEIPVRCGVACRGPALDPVESSLEGGLRYAAVRQEACWWLDAFTPPRPKRARVERAARASGATPPGELLAVLSFEGGFRVVVYRDAQERVIAELDEHPLVVHAPKLSWIDLDRTPPLTRTAEFKLEHGDWLCVVDASLPRADVMVIEDAGRVFSLKLDGSID